jgi:hypothetical protein
MERTQLHPISMSETEIDSVDEFADPFDKRVSRGADEAIRTSPGILRRVPARIEFDRSSGQDFIAEGSQKPGSASGPGVTAQ